MQDDLGKTPSGSPASGRASQWLRPFLMVFRSRYASADLTPSEARRANHVGVVYILVFILIVVVSTVRHYWG